MPAARPFMLRGISGVNDNAAEVLPQLVKAKKAARQQGLDED